MPNKIETQEHLYVCDNNMLFWEHDGAKYCVLIQHDSCPLNPRLDYDNIATMFCNHPRYMLGEQARYDTRTKFWATLIKESVPTDVLLKRLKDGTVKGFLEHVKDEFYKDKELSDNDLLVGFYALLEKNKFDMVDGAVKDYIAYLPLWLYDHSGISLSCGDRAYPYNDQYDSMPVGWIALSKDKAMKELSASEDNWERLAEERMREEVKTYDQYLTGEVYQCTVYRYANEEGTEDRMKNGDVLYSDRDWYEYDIYGSFFGNDIFTNGMFESVGRGLEEAVRSGSYQMGEAKMYTEIRYTFIQHNNEKPKKKGKKA